MSQKSALLENPNTLKIIGASAILLVAIVVLGWGMGWFDRGPKPLDDNAERQERLQEEVEEDAEIDAKSRVRNYESGG
jgi:hypothetical protein